MKDKKKYSAKKHDKICHIRRKNGVIEQRIKSVGDKSSNLVRRTLQVTY
jgi:hypothetical protein